MTREKEAKHEKDGAPGGKEKILAERRKALDMALAAIRRNYGEGAIMKLGSHPGRLGVEVIPTGALPLDIALGTGGMPRGRVVEIYGPESSGKTTLALHIAAEAQKRGGIAAFIDAEHALDPEWARKIGVNVDDLLVSQPDNGEQALEIADQLVRSGAADVIVVDSVAALVPKAEIEGEMGEPQVGLQARLMSQALRKLTGIVSRSRTCVIFINQIRQKIGVMFGNPETTPGGLALKFYASVRLDIRRIATVKEGDRPVASRIRVTVRKNKLAPPFRVAEFDMTFDRGISRAACLVDLGLEHGIVQKSGTFLAFGAEKLGQGRQQAIQFLEGSPAAANSLEEAIRRKALGPGDQKEAPSPSGMAAPRTGGARAA